MSETNQNHQLVQQLYDAFARGDGPAMAQVYHPDATFSDPVFPALRGDEIGSMWKMLTSRAKDLRIEYTDVTADSEGGRARWEAWYTFNATGKSVHNIIEARFTFSDGKILRHEDTFDFYRWSRMALGVPGWVLGWTPLIRKKVRSQAASQLKRFRTKAAQA